MLLVASEGSASPLTHYSLCCKVSNWIRWTPQDFLKTYDGTDHCAQQGSRQKRRGCGSLRHVLCTSYVWLSRATGNRSASCGLNLSIINLDCFVTFAALWIRVRSSTLLAHLQPLHAGLSNRLGHASRFRRGRRSIIPRTAFQMQLTPCCGCELATVKGLKRAKFGSASKRSRDC